jgi:hypothetical protein
VHEDVVEFFFTVATFAVAVQEQHDRPLLRLRETARKIDEVVTLLAGARALIGNSFEFGLRLSLGRGLRICSGRNAGRPRE